MGERSWGWTVSARMRGDSCQGEGVEEEMEETKPLPEERRREAWRGWLVWRALAFWGSNGVAGVAVSEMGAKIKGEGRVDSCSEDGGAGLDP